jgi:glucokinase
MNSRHIVIGVDLGGSHVIAAAINEEGATLTSAERSIDSSKTADEIMTGDILPVIQSTMDMLEKDKPYVRGVGMGIPGHTLGEEGICTFAPNLKWRNVQVRKPLEEVLGLPVFIINDVRAATMGEKLFGNGKGIADFICMAIGTGIGGGVVANGRLVKGHGEGAGEIGHITVNPEGPLCGCGSHGCMEAYSSATGITRRAREALANGRESILTDYPEVTGKFLNEAAGKGDRLALEIWEETGKYLGIGMSIIVNILNPRRILLAGRVSEAMEFFMPAMKEEIQKRARMVPPDSTEIIKARFGKDAGLIGAGALVFEQLNLL